MNNINVEFIVCIYIQTYFQNYNFEIIKTPMMVRKVFYHRVIFLGGGYEMRRFDFEYTILESVAE